MGKTLKRQRGRQLKEQQQRQRQGGCLAQWPCKLPRLAGAPQHNAGSSSSSSKFTCVVSAAMRARDWLQALQALQAMARLGKVPKLGAVQRWVRDADQAGDEAVTARLIDAILRCTVPFQQQQQQQQWAGLASDEVAAHSGAANGHAADALKGTIKRHPPWSPQLPATAAAAVGDGSKQQQQVGWQQQIQQQQQQQQQQVQGQEQQQQGGEAGQQALPNYAELLYQVPFQPGAGGPDAIYAYPPGTALRFDPHHPPVTAVPVPFVPGALCLLGVLSAAECRQIIAAAEAIGYNANVDYTFGGALGGDGGAEASVVRRQQPGAAGAAAVEAEESEEAEDDTAAAAAAGGGGAGADGGSSQHASPAPSNEATAAASASAAAARKSAARWHAAELVGLQQGGPAQGCVWLVDGSVLQPIYERVKHLLPQELGGGALAGINARWRLYRYTPGNVYRPHIDGAWPGSGVDANGHYEFDAYGDRWSRLTFLVYLNDDFEGGHTTYYTANEQQEGCLDARGVQPRQGNVMVFPHGGTLGSLVHEGSAVLKGAKYVIRTDVLYMKVKGGSQRQKQQQQRQKKQRRR